MAILCMHNMIIWALQLLLRIKGLYQQISMSLLQRTRIICKIGKLGHIAVKWLTVIQKASVSPGNRTKDILIPGQKYSKLSLFSPQMRFCQWVIIVFQVFVPIHFLVFLWNRWFLSPLWFLSWEHLCMGTDRKVPSVPILLSSYQNV